MNIYITFDKKHQHMFSAHNYMRGKTRTVHLNHKYVLVLHVNDSFDSDLIKKYITKRLFGEDFKSWCYESQWDDGRIHNYSNGYFETTEDETYHSINMSKGQSAEEKMWKRTHG